MISEKIKNAGVIGAGGAGFPTHIKAASKAKILIANGAECEPLIHKDYELMLNFAERVIDGINLMLESTGAEVGIIGIKEKNELAIEAIKKSIKNNKKIQVKLLGDFYPTGDEFVLVYECTGKLIPSAGIPLDIGVVVNNVETFYNISLANENIAVTEKFLCVTGAVNNPTSFFAPVGTQFDELVKIAGGITVDNYALYVGGVMMGELNLDLSGKVTKTTSGIIVLPKHHKLITRKNQPENNFHRIGKSACDQCSFCTELCPRYILGYNIQPHKVMRSLEFTKSGEDLWNEFGLLCCSCGLCTLYSCPENLYPKEACDRAKASLRVKNIYPTKNFDVKVHPMYKHRRTPLKRLMKKLDLLTFEAKTPYKEIKFNPKKVSIKLRQGVGLPSVPCVKVGDRVKKGDLIAKIQENKLGANHHSSIDGKIVEISDSEIVIEA
ncbi:MAG TPA: 4Fe-4S dicluster domain-containing protein [Bacteroidota bacterium]|nr:4Fe-4S dicluster domain-containing protein [Bacteroidota bacterium]